MKHFVFVYGSLRKPLYNYYRCFDSQHAQFIDYVNLDGNYALITYSSCPYPFLIETNTRQSIVGEIYEIDDSTFNSINMMEIGAGYVPITKSFATINGPIEATFYLYKRQIRPEAILVEDGDWVKYVQAHLPDQIPNNYVQKLHNEKLRDEKGRFCKRKLSFIEFTAYVAAMTTGINNLKEDYETFLKRPQYKKNEIISSFQKFFSKK